MSGEGDDGKGDGESQHGQGDGAQGEQELQAGPADGLGLGNGGSVIQSRTGPQSDSSSIYESEDEDGSPRDDLPLVPADPPSIPSDAGAPVNSPAKGPDRSLCHRVDMRSFYGDDHPVAFLVPNEAAERQGKVRLYFPSDNKYINLPKSRLPTTAQGLPLLIPPRSECTHIRFRLVDGLDEWTVRAGGNDTIVPHSIIEDDVESWFGERCRNKPNVFLPIDSQFDKLTWNENGTWSGKRGPAAETNIPDACVEALFSPALHSAVQTLSR